MKASVAKNKDSIRIRVSLGDGQRLSFSPGLKYTPINLKAARQICQRIELDILAGCFDETFEKYSLTPKISAACKIPSLVECWKRYREYQSKRISPTTIFSEFSTIDKLLAKDESLLWNESKKLQGIASKNYSPRTCANCWKWLRACINWCIEMDICSNKDNPFLKIPSEFKQRKKQQQSLVFTASQREAIIEGFSSKHRVHYIHFIQFLFSTGCRPEEAIALTWSDIKDDHISINKAYSRGILKDTKTKSSRRIPLNSKLKLILKSQQDWIESINLISDLVFPSPRNTYIDLSNFGIRSWKPLIKELVDKGFVSEYLSVYHCRHTFISECLHKKIPIQQVAKWVGNSPEIIWRNYAGILEDMNMPEI